MNSFTSKALGWLLLATLVSCGNNNSSNTTYAPLEESEINPSTAIDNLEIEISTQKKVEFEADFSNFEKFKENINNYVVVFRPKSKALANADITCKKNYFTQKPQPVTGRINASADKTTIELTINQDDPHKIQFSCEVSLDDSIVANYKGQLLKSFVVSGEKNWSHLMGSETEIDTLILENSSTLYSRDINVELKVKKLISNYGRIATFPFGFEDTTLDNDNGLSGGKIKIHATEAHGTIAFDLRGLNGGKQTNKPEKREPLPRDPNLDGKCPSRIHEFELNPALCTGKDGHKGLKGHAGFQGMKGGNSGSLNLTIDTNFLQIAVQYYPGLGGQGGEGGEGGLGSPGGRGNKVDVIPYKDGPVCPRCRIEASNSTTKFPDGKQGPNGDKGDQGPKGKTGDAQESVIIIENTKEIINSFWKNN